MSLEPALVAFALVFPVELPDKTLLATVLLAARFRPLPVYAGVCAAFAVQCGIAVAFGGVLTLLPGRLVAGVVAVLFGIGAVVLLREGFGAVAAEGPTAGGAGGVRPAGGTGGAGAADGSGATVAADGSGIAGAAAGSTVLSPVRIALTSFGVLFVAEFGDASQLATAALAARYGQPLPVGIGAFLALATVAGIAVVVGKRAGDRVPRRLLLRIGGVAFAVLALLAATEATLG